MTQLADQRQRDAALDLTKHILLKAPAGSGKTTLLTNRFLKALAVVEKPEHVVAITFTKKAAAEMRARIASRLSQSTDDPIINAVRERDRTLDWNLSQNISRLRITTIDSFCASITRALPLTSELGSAGKPTENEGQLYEEAIYRLVADLDQEESDDQAAAGQALSQLLDWHDNRIDDMVAPLAGLLRCRDQWLPALIQRIQTGETSGESVLVSIAKDLLAAFAEHFDDDLWGLFVECWGQRRIDHQNSPSDFDDGLSEDAHAIINSRKYDAVNPAHAAALGQLLRPFLKANGTELLGATGRSLTKRQGWISKSASQLAAFDVINGIQALNESARGDLLEAIAKLAAFPGIEIPDSVKTYNESFDVVLLRLVQHLHLVFAERGEVDFLEIAQRAIATLAGAEGNMDVMARIDQRLDHLLVDEMQDTAYNQIRLLTLLTDHWAPGDGRSLFLVGDPQQSIYGFRNADVSIFIDLFVNKRLRGTDRPLPLTCLELTTNFRSDAGVVNYNNTAFGRLLPSQDRVLTGQASAVASDLPPGKEPDAGEARVRWIQTRVKEKFGDADNVVVHVQELNRRYPGDRIAIIGRSRNSLRSVVPGLEREGIAFVADEVDSLLERPESRAALATVKALWHPGDDAAWVALLRSPLVGMTWRQIHAIHIGARRFVGQNSSPLGTWEDRLYLAHEHELLPEASRDDLQRIVAALRAVRIPQLRGLLAEQAEALWFELGGPLTLNGAVEVLNVQKLFSTVADFAKEGMVNDLEPLLKKLEKSYGVTGGVQPNVSLMTIHKAKGLEFEHVCVVGCNAMGPSDDKPLLAMLPFANDTLSVPKPDGFSDDETWRQLYDMTYGLVKQRRKAEAIRVAYVAGTRAIKSLAWFETRDVDNDGLPVAPSTNSISKDMAPAIDALPGGIEVREVEESEVADADPVAILPAWKPKDPERIRQLFERNFIMRERRINRPSESAMTRRSGRPEAPEPRAATPTAEAIRRRLVGDMYHLAMERIANEGLSVYVNEPKAGVSRGAHSVVNPAALNAMAPSMRAGLRRMGLPAPLLEGTVAHVLKLIEHTLLSPTGRWCLEPKQWAASEFALSGYVDGQWYSAIIDRCFVEGDVLWVIDYKTGQRHDESEDYAAQLLSYKRLLAKKFPEKQIRCGLYWALEAELSELAFV